MKENLETLIRLLAILVVCLAAIAMFGALIYALIWLLAIALGIPLPPALPTH